MAKDEYIIIEFPFSLNKWIDPAEPIQPPSLFPSLKNYIPEIDRIETREGITEFSWS